MIPFLHGVLATNGGVASDFELIETQTVGAGGAASVTFSSIPSTYKHLQIRGIVTYGPPNSLLARFNFDSGNNYTFHQLYGTGSAAGSNGSTPFSAFVISKVSSGSPYIAAFSADILDYASTSKYKTGRTLTGYDANGGGIIGLQSGVWMNTAAITSVTLLGDSSNLAQYSTFSLYGVK